MSAHQAEWSAAKAAFFKGKLTGQDVPPDFVLALNQGFDFGPALKKFDSAKGYEERAKAILAVLKAKDGYLKEIAGAISRCSPAGRKAMTELKSAIEAIWVAAESETQPPRPSGQMVSAYSLRQYDLAAGVKPKFLKLEPITIDVDVEVDKEFKKLLDSGEAGYRVQLLGDAAHAELEKVGSAFKDTILKVDASIQKDPSILAAKTKEANEVLQYYRRLIEDRMNAAVAAEWQKYLQNKKYLSSFRVKTGLKIVLGTIGVGVAVASAILSFGTLWMNVVAAAKGVLDVAKTVKTAMEGIDTTFQKLLEDMGFLTKLNQQREAAKKKGEGQKASKAGQAAKEVISGLLPITKDMMKTAGNIDTRCGQFSGQISKLESSADQLSGKLDAIVKGLSGLPDKELSTEQRNVCKEMQKFVEDIFAELHTLTVRVRNANAFVTRVRKAVAELKRNDSWTGGLGEEIGTWGPRGAALLALGNFVMECANHGKGLITLL